MNPTWGCGKGRPCLRREGPPPRPCSGDRTRPPPLLQSRNLARKPPPSPPPNRSPSSSPSFPLSLSLARALSVYPLTREVFYGSEPAQRLGTHLTKVTKWNAFNYSLFIYLFIIFKFFGKTPTQVIWKESEQGLIGRLGPPKTANRSLAGHFACEPEGSTNGLRRARCGPGDWCHGWNAGGEEYISRRMVNFGLKT